MDALIKTSLYLSTVLLIGAGVYSFFIGHSRSRVVQRSSVFGFVVLTLASIAHLIQTVKNVLGRYDPTFIWQYTLNTQHGKMTLLRLALAIALLLIVVLVKSKTGAVLFSFAGLGLLFTFSLLSHATTMKGTPALIADLMHLSAASSWVGAILFSVLDKNWKSPHFKRSIKRISRLALVCVIFLVATGLYASLIHIKDLSALNTMYGRILISKVLTFTLTLGLAAINRWYFLPHLLSKQSTFRKALIVEAVLLVIVLMITGILTVSPVPHEM